MEVGTDSKFWDEMAPHHTVIENSFFDLRAVRQVRKAVLQPVLVVGAGQGLIVGDLASRGIRCDGVDFSPEMIRYAKVRRGLNLIQADARKLPFEPGSYGTVIYATGVIDFIPAEQDIRSILEEGRRVLQPGGKIFVGFYRLSRVNEELLKKVGLLKNSVVSQRAALQTYLLNPVQMINWIADKAHTTRLHAVVQLLKVAARTTFQEKRNTLRMQKLFRNRDVAKALIDSAPETLPYRDEAEIRKLFARLSIPIKALQPLGNCHLVEI